MFSLFPPNDAQIRTLLQKPDTFTYAEVGATNGQLPTGYNIDHNRVLLGQGAATFEAACQAVRQWKMFDIVWLQLCYPDTPLEVGGTVGVLARVFGVWALNICQIVYTLDEEKSGLRRFGFGYGTLSYHAEQGEERFTIEWNRADDSVWYDILAFSRPRYWLAKLGYPMARYSQKCFARDSKAAMLRAVTPR